MKTSLLIFIIVLGNRFISAGQATSSHDNEAVQNIVKQLFQGLADLDTSKVKAECFSDIQILESGKVWTLDSLLLKVTTRKSRSTDFKRINKLDFIETRIVGDMAWASYYNQAIISFDARPVTVKWLETVILQKVKNIWKIILLHSTELARS